jgi:hypothetical protein
MRKRLGFQVFVKRRSSVQIRAAALGKCLDSKNLRSFRRAEVANRTSRKRSTILLFDLEGMPVAKPKSRLPKLRHQKSRDLAVVRIDGRDHYLGKFGSPESIEKYHRVVGEWMVRGADIATAPDKGSPVASPNPTVGELILAYYNHAILYYQKPDGSPGSEVEKIKLASRPLRVLTVRLSHATLARSH